MADPSSCETEKCEVMEAAIKSIADTLSSIGSYICYVFFALSQTNFLIIVQNCFQIHYIPSWNFVNAKLKA